MLLVSVTFVFLYIVLAFAAPKIETTYNYTVKQPVDVAFKAMVNPFQFDNWIPGFKTIQPLTGNLVTVSSENIITLDYNEKEFHIFQKITAFDTNEKFACTLYNDRYDFQVSISLSGNGNETFMEVSLIATASSLFMRPLFFIGKSRIIKLFDGVFMDLATVMENRGTKGLFF